MEEQKNCGKCKRLAKILGHPCKGYCIVGDCLVMLDDTQRNENVHCFVLRDRNMEKEKGEVKVYGRSDDLIELEGDINKEFDWCGGEEAYLGFSDGTLLKIILDERWKITIIDIGEASVERLETTAEDSDVVLLKGTKFKWVMVSEKYSGGE